MSDARAESVDEKTVISGLTNVEYVFVIVA
jgi:hypothetical protein